MTRRSTVTLVTWTTLSLVRLREPCTRLGTIKEATARMHHGKGQEMSARAEDRNNEIVRRLFEDCLNSGNLAMLDDLIAADYAGPGGQRGPAAFAAPVVGVLRGFPDIHYSLEELVAEGERVAVKWTWRGTQTGEFAGIAATHKAISNEGMAIFHLRNGKITHSINQTDRLGFLQSLGVVSVDVIPQPTVAKPLQVPKSDGR